MTYKFDTDKAAPCRDCGGTTRFRFDKDYYSRGKPFCPCYKNNFVIGGIRSRDGVVIPSEVLEATKKKMEEYGFTGVTIVAADLESHPRGYKSIIRAMGHPNMGVYLEMLNNKKPERSFVVTYEYGEAILEHAPFETYCSTWNYVKVVQRSNRDLCSSVYRFLTEEMKDREQKDDYYTNVWKKPVLFRNKDYDAEQVRKTNDQIEARKQEAMRSVRHLEYLATESDKQAAKYRESAARKRLDFFATFGEEMKDANHS